MKKLLSYSLPVLASVLCIATAVMTGCESSSSGGGGGNSSNAVGHWKVTHFEGAANEGFFWHFNDDGSFSLNESSTTHGHRTGTYKVSGNRITGSGTNPGVGTFDIDFVMDGNTLTGDFYEHWNGGKHIDIVAVKL